MSAFEIATVIDIVVSTTILIIVFSFMVNYVKRKEENNGITQNNKIKK
jgi:putative effector of murein hydrolase LrgA (UPF0299 family)